MTQEEIQAIKDRMDAASPGHWVFDDAGFVYCVINYCIDVDKPIYEACPYPGEPARHKNNLLFITNAKEDIKKLLEELEHITYLYNSINSLGAS